MDRETQKLPGMSDGEALWMESNALEEAAQDPELTEEQRNALISQSEQAAIKTVFVTVRANFMSSRPGLELPYPKDGEPFDVYYAKVQNLVDVHDEMMAG